MRRSVAGLAMILMAAGCSHPGSDERAFEWVSDLPAGSVVHVKNGSGSIEVRRAGGQTAHAVGRREWRKGRARDVNFVATKDGNDYYLCAMWRNSGRCGASGYRGKNTGGFLSLFSLFHRTTDASADFIVELPANVVLDARNTTGDIVIDGLAAGVTARTTNGEVKATNVGGRVSLSTTNGDLVLEAEPGAALEEVSLTTTNGDIRAALPAATDGLFDLVTTNGDVRSDFPLEPTSKSRMNHLRGQIGASSRSVKLRTVNGDVVVTRGMSAEP